MNEGLRAAVEAKLNERGMRERMRERGAASGRLDEVNRAWEELVDYETRKLERQAAFRRGELTPG